MADESIPVVQGVPPYTIGYDPNVGQVAFPSQTGAAVAVPQQRSGGGKRPMGLTGTFGPILSITTRSGLVKKIVEGSCCPPNFFQPDGQFNIIADNPGTQSFDFTGVAKIEGVSIEAGMELLLYIDEAVSAGVSASITGLVVVPDEPAPVGPSLDPPYGTLGSASFTVDYVDAQQNGGSFFVVAKNPNCDCLVILGKIFVPSNA